MIKNRFLAAAATLALIGVVPAAAQDQLSSNSGSNSAANSGSVSGAESNGNQQGQTQANIGGNNAGIGSSRNDLQSSSSSGAISGSESDSRSNSDQAQGQSQNSNNSQGQSSNQGQSQGANNSQSQGQTLTAGQQATNQQGVSVATTFNSYDRKINRVYTNNAVPLAASSSFSSDYCGGTVSGGASAAPIGISIGGAGPTFDKSCQSLRRAEKFGMAAANASNMGQPELAGKLMAMMIWSICTSDSKGPKADASTAEACSQAALLGTTGGTNPAPGSAVYTPLPEPQQAVTPLETQKPNTAPPADDYTSELAPKTPRGSNDNDKTKIVPMAIAH